MPSRFRRRAPSCYVTTPVPARSRHRFRGIGNHDSGSSSTWRRLKALKKIVSRKGIESKNGDFANTLMACDFWRQRFDFEGLITSRRVNVAQRESSRINSVCGDIAETAFLPRRPLRRRAQRLSGQPAHRRRVRAVDQALHRSPWEAPSSGHGARRGCRVLDDARGGLSHVSLELEPGARRRMDASSWLAVDCSERLAVYFKSR